MTATMLPDLGALSCGSGHRCVPCGTPLPEGGKIADIELLECTTCHEPLGKQTLLGNWTGGEPLWVPVCRRAHLVHKVCLNLQLTNGVGKSRWSCSECREPLLPSAWAMVGAAEPDWLRAVREAALTLDYDAESESYRLV
tara:strand:+ start:4419 stop:4838 length:420 start_codon:yes stop_codon:yes gene_type:complete